MYAEAAPYSRDLNLKGYHKPMFYKDVLCKGSAIGIHSTRKLISPLFYKDLFYKALFYNDPVHEDLFYRGPILQGSIQWRSIL